MVVVVVITHIVTMKGKGDDKLKVNVIVSFFCLCFLALDFIYSQSSRFANCFASIHQFTIKVCCFKMFNGKFYVF